MLKLILSSLVVLFISSTSFGQSNLDESTTAVASMKQKIKDVKRDLETLEMEINAAITELEANQDSKEKIARVEKLKASKEELQTKMSEMRHQLNVAENKLVEAKKRDEEMQKAKEKRKQEEGAVKH